MSRVLILQGHPDGTTHHFCHSLADAYADSAVAHGHQVRRIDLGRTEFPLLGSQQEWADGKPPSSLVGAQADITWSDHLLIVYPLWLGDMPSKLKGFLEQVLRPGFAMSGDIGRNFRPLLRGKSARVVITMGMPALIYRWYFFAHSLRALKRNILAFVGVRPVRTTIVGGVGKMSKAECERWIDEMRARGALAT